MSYLRGETLPFDDLQKRIAELGAQPHPERSSSRMHIYFLPSRNEWLGVSKVGEFAQLGYYTECPCSGG